MGQILHKNTISSDMNFETFTLLWLDVSMNKTEDNVATQTKLRATINQLKTFENPDDCERYITSASNEDRIVLIVSGSLGRKIVPTVHHFEQLSSVYVYCQDKKENEKWSNTYPKVKAVVTKSKRINRSNSIRSRKTTQSRIYETLPISIFDPKIVHERLTTDLQGKLVHSQLLINCLLQMKANVTDMKQLISISKQIYEKNTEELNTIREFEDKYTPDEAIHWYMKDSFMFRLLNKALRTQNIDLLFLFQFFIVDIRKQLEKHRCNTSIKAYRNQLMSNEELQKLKKSTGQFISINSFFSAITDFNRACSEFESNDDLQRILFVIDADPSRDHEKPFANIESFSTNNEDEILFMIGSIFQIVDMNRDGTNMWIVKLKFFSDNHQVESMNGGDDKLLSFGHVLMTMGKVEEAEIYYRRLLEELESTNHADLARCYEALGAVANEKGEYAASLQLYEKALKINMKTSNQQPLDIASNYNSLGEVHRKNGDHEKALQYYNQALKTLGKNPIDKSLAKQAVCFNNIGIVYQEQQKHREALEFYRKAYDIRKKYFPTDETSLGMSCNNIGNAYYHINLYKDAIYYYEETLEIYERTLPPNHPKMASTFNNIGAIYDDQDKIEKALFYYRDALKI